MDESTLNDLLECSVCLERLDTTSKVLPCQHTFCRQCLQNIVSSHKALRCPECRVLIDAKIDDLPPNVLLMRILGGMKSAATAAANVEAAAAAKQPANDAKSPLIDLSQPCEGQLMLMPSQAANQHQPSSQQPHHHSTPSIPAIYTAAAAAATALHPPGHLLHHGNSNGNGHLVPLQPQNPPQSMQMQSPNAPLQNQYPAAASAKAPAPAPANVVPQARALFDYVSKDQGDVSFKKGDLIHLRKRLDAHWYHGELNGADGVFPVNHLQVLVPLPVPQCRALYDFRMGPAEEDGCLTFAKGAIITVLRRVDQNWAEGRIADCIGIFPIAFVEMNGMAKRVMDHHQQQVQQAQAAPMMGLPASGVVIPQPAEPQQPRLPAQNPPQIVPPVPVQPLQLVAVATPASAPSANPPPRRSALEMPESSSDSSSSSTLTNSASSPSTSSSNSSSTPTSPITNVVIRQSMVNRAANEHKRHSLTVLTAGVSNGSGSGSAGVHHSNRHSVEILSAPDPPEQSHQSPPPNNTDPSTAQHSLHHRRSHPGEPAMRPNKDSTSSQPQAAHSTSHSTRTRIVKSTVSHHPHHHLSGNPTSSALSSLHGQPPHLPANYIALYPYKPHKPDELELKKGAVYQVTERCQDGWFKGTCGSRGGKSGVFPGNYVVPMRPNSQRDRNQLFNLKQQQSLIGHTAAGAHGPPLSGPAGSLQHGTQNAASPQHNAHPLPHRNHHHQSAGNSAAKMMAAIPLPELPPRSVPANSGGDSVWTKPLGAHVESFFSRKSSANAAPKTERDKKDAAAAATASASNGAGGATISLMKRLTSIKRSKSPTHPQPLPPSAYSMDNPVFEDAGETLATIAAVASNQPKQRNAQLVHPVHVRSGSCPSQLLQNLGLDGGSGGGGGSNSAAFGSQRMKGHKERPNLTGIRPDAHSRSTPTRHLATTSTAGHLAATGPIGQQQPQHYAPHQMQPRLGGAPPQGQQPHNHANSSASASYHRKSHSLDATTIASQIAHSANSVGKHNNRAQTVAAANAMAERFRCIVPYPPNSEIELELHLNDIVLVHKKRDNGWYKGTHTRTGRMGLFPASFVEPDV